MALAAIYLLLDFLVHFQQSFLLFSSSHTLLCGLIFYQIKVVLPLSALVITESVFVAVDVIVEKSGAFSRRLLQGNANLCFDYFPDMKFDAIYSIDATLQSQTESSEYFDY